MKNQAPLGISLFFLNAYWNLSATNQYLVLAKSRNLCSGLRISLEICCGEIIYVLLQSTCSMYLMMKGTGDARVVYVIQGHDRPLLCVISAGSSRAAETTRACTVIIGLESLRRFRVLRRV